MGPEVGLRVGPGVGWLVGPRVGKADVGAFVGPLVGLDVGVSENNGPSWNVRTESITWMSPLFAS